MGETLEVDCIWFFFDVVIMFVVLVLLRRHVQQTMSFDRCLLPWDSCLIEYDVDKINMYDYEGKR